MYYTQLPVYEIIVVFCSGQVSQRDILNSIDREMSGDLKVGFRTVGELLTLGAHARGLL